MPKNGALWFEDVQTPEYILHGLLLMGCTIILKK
jgi:hypothetical protein